MKFTGERYLPEQSGQIEIEHLNRYYFALNQIDLADKIVLDLASGEGYGSSLLAQYSKHVTGIDISVEAIEYAKSKYIKNNLKFLVGDAINIPLEDHSIDVVVSFETLEHHDKHKEMIDEIKRVLKSEGILIMSSPDKYYYSDLPKYVNEFHVKELYYEEFKYLITSYFKKTYFFGQNIFIGSVITSDATESEYRKPLIVENNGNTFEFTPIYNVAIGTDSPIYYPKYQQVLYKGSDDFVTKEDINLAVKAVRNSKSYKIGNSIIAPFRLLKRFLFNK